MIIKTLSLVEAADGATPSSSLNPLAIVVPGAVSPEYERGICYLIFDF
jgi:hypothetical protein